MEKPDPGYRGQVPALTGISPIPCLDGLTSKTQKDPGQPERPTGVRVKGYFRVLSLLDQAHDPDQNHRSYESDDDGPDHSSTGPNADKAK